MTLQHTRPLSTSDEIRLIEILPGCRSQQLRANVHYHSLSDKPGYQALSYTWGNCFDKGTQRNLWFQYESCSSPHILLLDIGLVEITQNLADALNQVRNHDRPVVLWVDAICIDQFNDVEKTHQIQMMRRIFEQASQVIVWLGCADDTSDQAIEVLRSGHRWQQRTAELQKLGEHRINHQPVSRTEQEFGDELTAASFGVLFGLTVKSDVPIPPYPIKAVASFMTRAYWGRGWCIQEFAVAAKLSILCGDAILEDADMCIQVLLETWDQLMNAAKAQPYVLDHRPWLVTELRRAHRNIVHLEDRGFADDPSIETPAAFMPYKIWAYMNSSMTIMGKAWLYRECMQKLSLKSLLQESSTAWLETSKDHKEDQIFALLGLCKDATELGIEVDCSLTWEKVYTQVATVYRQRGDLWFLNCCQGAMPDRTPALPSWVPDWSMGYRGARFDHYFTAPADHLGTLEPAGKGLASFRGILADEVTWVSPERSPMSISDLGTPATWELYSWIRSVVSTCAESFTNREIWTVLIANARNLPLPEQYKDESFTERGKEILDDAFASILKSERIHEATMGSVVFGFLRCLMQITMWRSVFKTKEGRLGLALKDIKKGDRVAILMGNDTPFILRPTSDSPDECFLLLCDSYVHGLMEDDSLRSKTFVRDIVIA